VAKSLNNRQKNTLTLHDIEKIPAIKIRLDYKTVITVKDKYVTLFIGVI
jgi:hypothetical protein